MRIELPLSRSHYHPFLFALSRCNLLATFYEVLLLVDVVSQSLSPSLSSSLPVVFVGTIRGKKNFKI